MDMSRLRPALQAGLCSVWLQCGMAAGQTVPADLLDVSLEDLFSANIVENQEVENERWHLSYSYSRSTFDEYRDGSERLGYDDVLWGGPGETRTRKNFPVVPTKITQEVHSLLLAYEISSALGIRVSVPFIEQSTDHISIVPNYSDFNISSDGIGDVVAMVDYGFATSLNPSRSRVSSLARAWVTQASKASASMAFASNFWPGNPSPLN